MSGKQWLKNRIPFLLVNLFSMAALSAFLLLVGNTLDTAVFILTVWGLVLCAGLSISFFPAKRRYARLLKMAEGLEERYLIPEVMEKPKRAEDLVYWRLLKMAEKSMLEQVENGSRERKEYREYTEQWVHEIKTPITAIRLLCDNNRSDLTREIMGVAEKITQYTEQSLYYARSENTQNDYLIREIRLSDLPGWKQRFGLLRDLGVEDSHISRITLIQLGVWFGIPVGIGGTVSAVVMGYFFRMYRAQISAYIGRAELAVQTGAITLILLCLVLCYFVSTWRICLAASGEKEQRRE